MRLHNMPRLRMGDVLMKLISVSGYAGSGKTTFARVLRDQYGFEIKSFAATLKDEATAFLDKHEVEYEPRHIYGTMKDKDEILRIRVERSKPWGIEEMWFWAFFQSDNVLITPRQWLQFWGSEFRRTHFGEDYWTEQLVSQFDLNGRYVVDDTRFRNEYAKLRRLGAKMVRIDRWDAPASQHPSETDLDSVTDWDTLVWNRGTLEEFLARTVEYGGCMR